MRINDLAVMLIFHTLRFGMEIMGAVVRRGRIGYCALSIRDGRGVEVTQQ
jgi:hypothetical protein